MHLKGLGGLWDGLLRKELADLRAVGGRLPTIQKALDDALRAVAKGGLEDVLSAEEFGKRVGMHPKTVYRLARQRKLPCVRDGRSVMFRVSDARAWVAEHLED